MKDKNLNQIIKENLNASIKKFINEDISTNNDPSKLIEDFSINLKVYFDREKQKLIRKMNFGEQMKNDVSQINNTIMGLGYEFSKIETSEYDGEYTIDYYISGSNSWSDDEFIENESNITSYFEKNNFDISVDVNEDAQRNAYITLSFNLNILNEMDV